MQPTPPKPGDPEVFYDAGAGYINLENAPAYHTHDGKTSPLIVGGVGAPSAALGQNGMFYFRRDPVGATHIYFKTGGTWTALV